MGVLTDLFQGVAPVFEFILALWNALPQALQVLIPLFFGVAVGLVILRNFLL